MRRIIGILLFSFVCTLSFSAAFNVLITQDDGVQSEIRETTIIFEETILDCGFDYGHIISNEPINLERNTQKAEKIAFDASVEGYCDYLLTIYLKLDSVEEKAQEVIWKIVKIKDSSIISNGSKKVPTSKTKDFDSEKENLILFTKDFIKEVFGKINWLGRILYETNYMWDIFNNF